MLLNQYGSFSLAFPGGNTPIPVFNALRDKTKSKVINWSKVHVYWIDERYVPLDHQDSNFKLCYEKLLKYNKNINYYPINTKIAIHNSVKEYEKNINKLIKHNEHGIPSFDLIFMGVGSDGHIASLFPDSKALDKNNNNIIIPVYNSKNHKRITFSIKLLNSAKNRIIGIIGKNKIKVYDNLKYGKRNNYPLKYLLQNKCQDYWIIKN